MRKRNRIISAFLLLLFVIVLYLGAADTGYKEKEQGGGKQKEEIIVAVLDTGYTGDSDRIIGEAVSTIDGKADINDGNGHGTDMINIILDYTPEQVKVLPVKIADYMGYSTEEAAYQGIRYAMENHADIIHMSLNMSNLDKDSKLAAILEEAIHSGIDVVVSAGNSAKDVKDVFPANIEGAIVASATDTESNFWEYSNFGNTIDFAANGSYLGKQGTSYAAAKVTAMLADEYISGGSFETLKEKAVDAGDKGKDDYYGYGVLSAPGVVSEEIQKETYIGKSEHDIGPRLLELDWENTDAELLEKYFIETHRAYVGMYLSGLGEEELERLKEKVPVLNTEVLVQDFELNKIEYSYKEVDSHSEDFIANALKTYQSYEEELSISAEFLMLRNEGYFAVSSHNRNDIYYFEVSGFTYTVANTESPYFEMFQPNNLKVTRTVVKQTTDFGAVYVAGLTTFASSVSNFAIQYTDANTGAVSFNDDLFAIDCEADNGILSYGLAVTLGGYSNYKAGYHTTETDIVQIPYNYSHTYSQYSYAAYPEPLQYVFSYYIPETNGVGYSDVPQRVAVQPKNFKKLTPVNVKVWYDGVYKDGYDYRNVNESLSFSDKLNTYLSSWREKTVYGVNMYSTETSLTDTSLTINFNLSNSMAIQWNNGETATVVTRSDIPEYNFPLVINTYTVKYNGNGATSGSMSNMTMTYGAAKNLSANQFSRTGYKFKGWSTSATGGVVYSDKQSVNNLTTQHNVTVNLYAVWEPITYTVKYHGNGATGGSMSDSTMTYDKAQNLTANGFSKTGYSFSGWSTSANGAVVYTNKQSVKNLTSTSGGTINLYAVWGPISYTVKYHGNGATGGSMSDTVMTYDKAANLAANKFSRTGYKFKGWSTSTNGSVVYSDKQSVKNLTSTSGGTVNLYAVWEAVTYTVKYHGNGATSGSMSDSTMTYDKSQNLAANKFSKTGYSFKGWSTSVTGGVVYTDKQSVKNLTATLGGTVNLYAVWDAITYTIKYHGNGATGGSMPDTVMTYDKATNLAANKFTRTGYLFQGWSTSTTGSVVYTDQQSVKNLTTTAGSTINLYAVWKPITYTLKFRGNGATSGSMPDIAMTYDTPVNLTVNRFTKTGYTFKNWNTKADGSGTSYADGASVKNLTTQNGATVTLYAQWKANPYTIVFHSNGGTGNMESITAVYDTPIQLPANRFTKETEYGVSVFEGWNRDATSLISSYPNCGTVLNLTVENNGTVHLYAVWDDCPWIVAEDVYYTLEEAQSGQITYDELMSHASAHDREDGSPVLPGYNPEKGTTFQLIDYQPSDFTQFEHDGSVTETYEVIDSAGSRYIKMITVHVVDTSFREILPVGTTRFISEKYYRESYGNGGLPVDSLWKTDAGYRTELESAFANSRNNTPIVSYAFTYEQIQQMKDFVQNNGIGNLLSTDALQRFYEQFM